MLPLICIVVAICSGLATVALNWDNIVIAFKGKKLAVLGARHTGKTHLIQFLTSGSIPSNYGQTTAPDKTPKRRFQLRDLSLNLKESLDVGGDVANYAEWKDLIDKADAVFYLLRADKLLAGERETEARVRADMKHVEVWLESLKQRPQFFIVGTHCDHDPEFYSISADRLGDYVDKFRRIPAVVEIVARAGGSGKAKVILGSMKTIENTEALVYQIFKQIDT